MKKTLLIIAEIVLGAVVLAVITNIIANYVSMPLWVAVLIGVVALAGLIAITVSYQYVGATPNDPRDRGFPPGQVQDLPLPPEPTPPSSSVASGGERAASVGGNVDHSAIITGDGDHSVILAEKVYLPPPPEPAAPPFQVPRDTPHFVGREESMATLESALSSGAVAAVCGVAGLGGIGKSALANHFATVHRDLFPDGVLYASLRDSEPLMILGSLAAAYGEDVSGYVDLPSRSAAVRSVLSGKRALVILDNAEEIETVREILPGCGDCAILLTTRDAGLAAAVATGEVLRLAELSPEESLALLGKLAGVARVDAEKDAAREIGSLLGRLPLAVEIAGKLARLRSWGMGELLSKLRDERLKVLKLKDLEVRTSFGLSYELLEDGQQTLFAVLGALRGLSFAVAAAGDIAGVGEAGEELDALCDLSLLWQEEGRRFRQHPLLSDFAAEKLRDSGRQRELLEVHAHYYLSLAEGEDERLPHADTIVPARMAFEAEFPQIEAGRGWALKAGLDQLLVDYAFALRDYFLLVGLYRDWVEWNAAGVDAARRLGQTGNEGALLGNLGIAYRNLGQVQEAIKHYEQALAIAREIGDRAGEGVHLGNLGNAYRNLGQVREAIGYHERALEIAQEIGDRWGEGRHLGNLGNAYYSLGQVQEAIGYHERALAIAQEIGDRRNEVSWLGGLGSAYYSLDQVQEAIEYYERALEIAQEIGDRRNEGACLGGLGIAYGNLGQVDKAEEHYRAALAIAREVGDAMRESQHSRNLSLFYEEQGKLSEALALQERCVEIKERLELPDAEKYRRRVEELRARVDKG